MSLIFLSGPDHEDVPHRLVVGRRARERVALDARRQHPVRLRDGEVLVGDDRIVGCLPLGLLDVLRPVLVPVGGVDREPDDLDAAPVELGLDLRHVAELGRADGREVLRMGEEDRPRVADPVVELDPPFRRVGLEVRCSVVELQSHFVPPVRLPKNPAGRAAAAVRRLYLPESRLGRCSTRSSSDPDRPRDSSSATHATRSTCRRRRMPPRSSTRCSRNSSCSRSVSTRRGRGASSSSSRGSTPRARTARSVMCSPGSTRRAAA